MDPSRHSDNRGTIESILRKIPGFKGYLEKEYRRESDQLARNYIADKLQSSKSDLDKIMRQELNNGQLNALPEGERLKAKIDKVSARIKGDVQGYSGFFDFVKVDESLLDDVYEQDIALAGEAESFVGAMNLMITKGGSATQVFSEMIDAIDALEKKYNKRGEILEGIDGK
ncbi:MAG: hypothetical protein ACI9HK_002567 [Pirellulaceae bacterium]|jgi:hypothetical protein